MIFFVDGASDDDIKYLMSNLNECFKKPIINIAFRELRFQYECNMGTRDHNSDYHQFVFDYLDDIGDKYYVIVGTDVKFMDNNILLEVVEHYQYHVGDRNVETLNRICFEILSIIGNNIADKIID